MNAAVTRVARAVGLAVRKLAGRRWSGYFDGYPESWADRLGGVDRRSRARTGARSATMPP